MRYEIDLINEVCGELGIRSEVKSPGEITIELEEGLFLRFENFEDDDDCLVAFEGTEWHGHGDFTFVGSRGYYVEVTYLDAISGIVDGTILICERWKGTLVDRWLIHREYVDEFKYMQDGEEIRIRRALSSRSGSA